MSDPSAMSDAELLAAYQRAKAEVNPKSPEGVFQVTLARERAKDDADKLAKASEAQRQGYGMEATALQAEATLPNAPVGRFSNVAEFMGTTAPALGGFLGVPDKGQTAALQGLGRLQSMGALGDSQNLKGPMSDKDIAFLKGLQYDPQKPREYNDQVVAAQKWAARRQTAYGAALKAWTRTLGAPSATNASGLDFDSWWGRYSAERIPPPGVSARPSVSGGETQSAPSPTAGAPRKGAADPFPGVREGQIVRQGEKRYRRKGNQMVEVR